MELERRFSIKLHGKLFLIERALISCSEVRRVGHALQLPPHHHHPIIPAAHLARSQQQEHPIHARDVKKVHMLVLIRDVNIGVVFFVFFSQSAPSSGR